MDSLLLITLNQTQYKAMDGLLLIQIESDSLNYFQLNRYSEVHLSIYTKHGMWCPAMVETLCTVASVSHGGDTLHCSECTKRMDEIESLE